MFFFNCSEEDYLSLSIVLQQLWSDEDCFRPNPPILSDTVNITTIWAGALGGILAIVIMIVIVIIVLILVRYSRRTKTSNILR